MKAIRLAIRLIACICLCLLSAATIAQELADVHASEANGDYEPAVVDLIESIQSGELARALEQADQHLARFPKSRVGHFLRADILAAMSAPLPSIGAGVASKSEQIDGLKHQIKNRWRHTKAHIDRTHTHFPPP